MGVECSGGAGGSSLVVRWATPAPVDHNGVLQGYRLTLMRLDDTTGKCPHSPSAAEYSDKCPRTLLQKESLLYNHQSPVLHQLAQCVLHCLSSWPNAEEVDEVVRRTAAREETVMGLRPWTNYTVTVAAVTRAGPGVTSPDLTCTTREDGMAFTLLTRSSFVVLWALFFFFFRKSMTYCCLLYVIAY